jgi:NADH dehydrogenase (ubiquinone) 1 alpha subcomplex subunit 9
VVIGNDFGSLPFSTITSSLKISGVMAAAAVLTCRSTGRHAIPAVQRVSTPIVQRAHAHDLTIKRKTGLPIQRSGPFGGGRSSVSGHVATVFGATGFLGRYVVNRLAQKGTQVVIPYRDEDGKRHLKLMGDLGQIVPLEFDLRNDEQLAECMRHSDVVYNLIGRNHETKNFKYNDVNVAGPSRLAQIAQELGVSRFIHVSHINADANSPSAFLRTKAEGEEAVKRAFDGATIVRPGHLFGHEDRFLNQMASYPLLWHVNHMRTKMRPVHSVDVAQALAVLCDAELTSIGQTFSLAGPRTYTIAEMLKIVESLTYNKILRIGLNVPKFVLNASTKIGDLAWWPMFSPDEVIQRYIDDKADEAGTLSWADLGMQPDTLEERAILYLRRYRNSLHFEEPVEGSGMKLRKGRYHVVD